MEKRSIKLITKELIVVLILRYISIILPIDLYQLLNDSFILSILVSLFTTYEIYIKNNDNISEIRKKYLIVVGLIGLIINFVFGITSMIIILLLKTKQEKNDEIVKKNIDEYLKNKN